MERKPLRTLGRIVAGPMALAAYAAVVFEEYVWDKAKVAMERIGRLPAVSWAESALRKAPPWAAMLCFFIPGLSVVPFKLAAVSLISHGHAFAGAALFVGAKTVGAALVGRVWKLTEPALRSVPFIDRNVDKLFAAKDAVKEWSSNLWSVRYAKIAVKKAARATKSVAGFLMGSRDAQKDGPVEKPNQTAAHDAQGPAVRVEALLAMGDHKSKREQALAPAGKMSLSIDGIEGGKVPQIETSDALGLLPVRSKLAERQRASVVPVESGGEQKGYKP